jgi:uncharacterized membrane-anchored protein
MVYNSGHEPTLTLASGKTVLRAVYETLLSVERAGHCVSIDDEQDVWVTPSDLHPDVAFVLVSNSHDLALILAQQIGPVH